MSAFRLACTVAWTELLLALREDGVDHDDKAGPATAKWIEEIARDALGAPEIEKQAARYRWLRDTSVPPHNFYLSVPIEFDGVRYTPGEVDAAIDAAIKAKEKTP